ncbi:MAG: hypothetical protein IT458_03040 [Planctomycetes bacterium]|nr:hypothetical protein [Planctomycetota bacterium]
MDRARRLGSVVGMEKNSADGPDGISLSWEQLVPATMKAADVKEKLRLALEVPAVWLALVRLEKRTVQQVQTMLDQVPARLRPDLERRARARLRELESEEGKLRAEAASFLSGAGVGSRRDPLDWLAKDWPSIHDRRGSGTVLPDDWWWKPISENLTVPRMGP